MNLDIVISPVFAAAAGRPWRRHYTGRMATVALGGDQPEATPDR
jgi:hypothetical protein